MEVRKRMKTLWKWGYPMFRQTHIRMDWCIFGTEYVSRMEHTRNIQICLQNLGKVIANHDWSAVSTPKIWSSVGIIIPFLGLKKWNHQANNNIEVAHGYPRAPYQLQILGLWFPFLKIPIRSLVLDLCPMIFEIIKMTMHRTISVIVIILTMITLLWSLLILLLLPLSWSSSSSVTLLLVSTISS